MDPIANDRQQLSAEKPAIIGVPHKTLPEGRNPFLGEREKRAVVKETPTNGRTRQLPSREMQARQGPGYIARADNRRFRRR